MYIPETVLAYLCQRHMCPPRCEMRRRFRYGPQLNGLELLTYMLFLSIFYNRKRFSESKTGSRPTKYQLAIAAIHSYSGMHSTTRVESPDQRICCQKSAFLTYLERASAVFTGCSEHGRKWWGILERWYDATMHMRYCCTLLLAQCMDKF